MRKAMPAGRQGLTLIECAIGIIIISIAFYTLIAVYITLTPRSISVESIDKKVFLAQEKMEEYIARPYGSVESVSATPFGGDFAAFNYQIIATTVATNDLGAAAPSNLKSVKVRVWGGPVDRFLTVEVVTLIATYEIIL